MEAKNNAYGFDYLAEYNIYKKMRKQDAKDDGILYVTEYSDWKARIQKNYEQQKENEDFCHFLVQKKRDIENLKKTSGNNFHTACAAGVTRQSF